MTLKEIRTRVLERLDSTGGVPYTASQVDEAVNEAQGVFAFLTLCVERTAVEHVSAGATWRSMQVDLPDWIVPLRMKCRRVEVVEDPAMWDAPMWDTALFDDPGQEATLITRVAPATLSELDALDPAWQTAAGATVERYGTQGADLRFLYPTPAEPGTFLQTTYAALPRRVAKDSDVPEIPADYHPALVSWPLATLPLRFGGVEASRHEAELDTFLDSAIRCADFVRARAKSLRYDNYPFELRLFDRSRFRDEARKKR